MAFFFWTFPSTCFWGWLQLSYFVFFNLFRGFKKRFYFRFILIYGTGKRLLELCLQSKMGEAGWITIIANKEWCVGWHHFNAPIMVYHPAGLPQLSPLPMYIKPLKYVCRSPFLVCDHLEWICSGHSLTSQKKFDRIMQNFFWSFTHLLQQ